MSFSPMYVTNNILSRAFADDVEVTPMKLQKLLWFVAAEYAKGGRGPLLHEQFEVWDYGPVIRSVHDKFLPFACRPITRYSRDAAGVGRMVNKTEYPAFTAVLDDVWAKAGGWDAVQLARLTHVQGSAWHQAKLRGHARIDEREMAGDLTYLSALALERPSSALATTTALSKR